MKHRDYQVDAINAIFNFFKREKTGHPIVAMPTGTGKSHVIAGFIESAMKTYPSTRVLKLTHSKELIEQNADKMRKLWPGAPLGVYSAGLSSRDIGFPITFAGIGSVYKRAAELGRIDLVLVDECHLIGPNQSSMYQKLFTDLRELNPGIRIIGLTATHYRMGQGSLLDGKSTFTDICIDMTTVDGFNWFIDQGYLSPLVPRCTELELDVSDVGITNGDFKKNELMLAVDKAIITKAAVEEAVELGKLRNKWLVFASGIEHAEHVTAELDRCGISSTCVHSKMKSKDRDRNIAAFREGFYTAIVNNGILTTGFDDPGIDMEVMLRPTNSPGLWVQMLGRGTRPNYAPGYDLSTVQGRLDAIENGDKKDCLVLDFARNTPRLGPINDPVLPRRRDKKKGGAAPVRLCPACGTYNHASAVRCFVCGEEFPRQLKIDIKPATERLVAPSKIEDPPLVEIFSVNNVVYSKGEKMGKPPHMKVTYTCGLRTFRETVCFEHGGWADSMGRKWWADNTTRSDLTTPKSVAEALQRVAELRPVTYIRVWVNKRHPEVMGRSGNPPIQQTG